MYPLLNGKDLLNRFKPLIDFKHLKIWTQVREPLPCQSLNSNESQCQVTDIAPKSVIDDCSRKTTKHKQHGPFPLLSAGAWTKHRPPSNHYCDRGSRHISVRHSTNLWAENSAISLKLFRTLKQRHQRSTICLNTACDRITYTGDHRGTQSLSNDQTDAPHKAGAIHDESWTFHALSNQPFGGISNRRPARLWRAHPCPLPHCHITSVRCWQSPHPPKCGFVTTKPWQLTCPTH